MSAPPISERLDWVDTTKAIAIWLIVLGHAMRLMPVEAVRFVYAFHVLVFVLISGFLMPRAPLAQGLGLALAKRVMPMLRYYLFFSALAVAFDLGLNLLRGRQIEPALQIWGALYGTTGEGIFGYSRGFLHPDLPLWYLPFLVSSLLVFLLALPLGRWAAGAPARCWQC